MTKKQYFEKVMALAQGSGDAEVIEMTEKELASITKREEAATQKKIDRENEAREQVLPLVTAEGVTAKEIGEAVGVSSQKATVYLKLLETLGLVTSEKADGGRGVKVYKLV